MCIAPTLPGQTGDIVPSRGRSARAVRGHCPGQTGDNVGVVGFVCPDCNVYCIVLPQGTRLMKVIVNLLNTRVLH